VLKRPQGADISSSGGFLLRNRRFYHAILNNGISGDSSATSPVLKNVVPLCGTNCIHGAKMV
jgi:hypothetical protein